MNNTFSVTFEIVDRDENSSYICGPDGETTEDQGEAHLFVFRAQPTGLDATNIARRQGVIGAKLEGLDTADLTPWIDLRDGIEHMRSSLVASIDKRIWPDGRPKVEGTRRREDEDKFNAEWETIRARPNDALYHLMMSFQELLEQIGIIEFFAKWNTLLVVVQDGTGELIGGQELEQWKQFEDTVTSGKYGRAIRAKLEHAWIDSAQKKTERSKSSRGESGEETQPTPAS